MRVMILFCNPLNFKVSLILKEVWEFGHLEFLIFYVLYYYYIKIEVVRGSNSL